MHPSKTQDLTARIRFFDGRSMGSQGSNIALRSKTKTLIRLCRPGPQMHVRVRNWKLFFLFLNQNICCVYSKELSRWDGSFEHPNHMFKLMEKKIFVFYAFIFGLTGPMADWFESLLFEPNASVLLIGSLFRNTIVQDPFLFIIRGCGNIMPDLVPFPWGQVRNFY